MNAYTTIVIVLFLAVFSTLMRQAQPPEAPRLPPMSAMQETADDDYLRPDGSNLNNGIR